MRIQMKLAVILDGNMLPRFALDALDAIEGCDELTILDCTNTRRRKSLLKHAFYYGLNLLSIRNPRTRLVNIIHGSKRVAQTITFESGYDGAWQTLPKDILCRIADNQCDVILKFGMGLLRVPPADELDVPILSYHHGDPDHYRGRPAGFWEIWKGESVLGQMIQIIGNQLDAGAIVAVGETMVYPWSYRRTLIEAYSHSPLLINAAIRNATAGRTIEKQCTGRNYRLPTNRQVARFVAHMAVEWIRRLFYGAFVEKRWNVSHAHIRDGGLSAIVENGSFPKKDCWNTLTVPKEFAFYADPFFSHKPPGILVEALRRKSGLGEIVLVKDGAHRRISDSPGHMSYPATVEINGQQLLVPEIAGWSEPKIFRFEGEQLKEFASLHVEGNPRLLDPTLWEHEGRTYLFANNRALGPNALFLWSADSVEGPFHQHAGNPIRISPVGSRMAGQLTKLNGKLIRFGQDARRGYGDGIIAFEVEAMTPELYREHQVGSFRFDDRHGPHTLNIQGTEILFDWYSNRFAPLAGARRLVALRAETRRSMRIA
jgi:hypothetical protein